ncbi:MAG: LolA family protein [Silanimonas sp.]
MLRASFAQERRIAGFRHPLRSEGEVLLVRGEGLRWHTRAPFPSTLLVRDGRLWLRDADGRRQDIADGGHVATLVQELLGALLSGDRAALATRFTVSDAAAPRDGAWALALVPKGEPLASLYGHIDILGSTHVERLTLQERGGARTTIHFHDTRVQAQAGDAERRALD